MSPGPATRFPFSFPLFRGILRQNRISRSISSKTPRGPGGLVQMKRYLNRTISAVSQHRDTGKKSGVGVRGSSVARLGRGSVGSAGFSPSSGAAAPGARSICPRGLTRRLFHPSSFTLHPLPFLLPLSFLILHPSLFAPCGLFAVFLFLFLFAFSALARTNGWTNVIS